MRLMQFQIADHFGADREIRLPDTIIGQIITDGEWNYRSTFGGYYYYTDA